MKIKTGISGFDALVDGGFPKGRTVLLSGMPGTGKTIFALQFIYNGATQFKEKGLYISLEENADSLKRQAALFGLNLEQPEKEGLLRIVEIPAKNITERTAKEIIQMAQKGNYTRLVIDSLSTLAINTPTLGPISDITEIAIKRFIYHFIHELRGEVTSLLISHSLHGELSGDKVSEFVCDGIIHITSDAVGGDYSRSLIIKKMREVKHDEDIHALEISKKGIVIHALKD